MNPKEKTARRLALVEQMLMNLRIEREQLYQEMGEIPPALEDTEAQIASAEIIRKNAFLQDCGLLPK